MLFSSLVYVHCVTGQAVWCSNSYSLHPGNHLFSCYCCASPSGTKRSGVFCPPLTIELHASTASFLRLSLVLACDKLLVLV